MSVSEQRISGRKNSFTGISNMASKQRPASVVGGGTSATTKVSGSSIPLPAGVRQRRNSSATDRQFSTPTPPPSTIPGVTAIGNRHKRQISFTHKQPLNATTAQAAVPGQQRPTANSVTQGGRKSRINSEPSTSSSTNTSPVVNGAMGLEGIDLDALADLLLPKIIHRLASTLAQIHRDSELSSHSGQHHRHHSLDQPGELTPSPTIETQADEHLLNTLAGLMYSLTQSILQIERREGERDNILNEGHSMYLEHDTSNASHAAADDAAAELPPPVLPQMQFINDVNLPPGTIVQNKHQLIKVWRVRNTGATVWPDQLKLQRIHLPAHNTTQPKQKSPPSAKTNKPNADAQIQQAPSTTAQQQQQQQQAEAQRTEEGKAAHPPSGTHELTLETDLILFTDLQPNAEMNISALINTPAQTGRCCAYYQLSFLYPSTTANTTGGATSSAQKAYRQQQQRWIPFGETLIIDLLVEDTLANTLPLPHGSLLSRSRSFSDQRDTLNRTVQPIQQQQQQQQQTVQSQPQQQSLPPQAPGVDSQGAQLIVAQPVVVAPASSSGLIVYKKKKDKKDKQGVTPNNNSNSMMKDLRSQSVDSPPPPPSTFAQDLWSLVQSSTADQHIQIQQTQGQQKDGGDQAAEQQRQASCRSPTDLMSAPLNSPTDSKELEWLNLARTNSQHTQSNNTNSTSTTSATSNTSPGQATLAVEIGDSVSALTPRMSPTPQSSASLALQSSASAYQLASPTALSSSSSSTSMNDFAASIVKGLSSASSNNNPNSTIGSSGSSAAGNARNSVNSVNTRSSQQQQQSNKSLKRSTSTSSFAPIAITITNSSSSNSNSSSNQTTVTPNPLDVVSPSSSMNSQGGGSTTPANSKMLCKDDLMAWAGPTSTTNKQTGKQTHQTPTPTSYTTQTKNNTVSSNTSTTQSSSNVSTISSSSGPPTPNRSANSSPTLRARSSLPPFARIPSFSLTNTSNTSISASQSNTAASPNPSSSSSAQTSNSSSKDFPDFLRQSAWAHK